MSGKTDCDKPRMASVLLENIHFPHAGQRHTHFHTYFVVGLPFYVCLQSACFKEYTVQQEHTWDVKRVGT